MLFELIVFIWAGLFAMHIAVVRVCDGPIGAMDANVPGRRRRRAFLYPEGLPLEAIETQLALLHDDRPAFNRAAVAAFLGSEYEPSGEFLRWGLDHAARASLVAQAATFRAFSTTDFRADLRAVTVPSLIIHEEQDQATPLGVTAVRTAAGIAGCELRVHPGSSHAPFLTSKRRFNGELLEFLSRKATAL